MRMLASGLFVYLKRPT